jgi:hypothetical protein
MSKFPNGAEAVIAARKRGMKPSEMLIVSLIGAVNESNHTIYANPESEYDWRWLVGLKVCIYINDATKWKPISTAIARARPEWMGIYNADQFKGADVSALPLVDDIEKPMSQWRYRLNILPWMDFQNKEFAWSA